MSKLKNIAIGVGSFFGVRYLWSLYRAKNKVLTTISAEREALTIQGIAIKLKYNIKNPTTANISMTPPLIKLLFNGRLIASSTMSEVDIPTHAKDVFNSRIKIEAGKETGDITTKIVLPWLSLLVISPELVARLKSTDPKDKIKIQVESIAQLYTAVANFPYEETITLNL
jgi:hypothetical protein